MIHHTQYSTGLQGSVDALEEGQGVLLAVPVPEIVQEVAQKREIDLSIETEVIVLSQVQLNIGKTIASQSFVHGAEVVALCIGVQDFIRILRVNLSRRANSGCQHFCGVTGIGSNIQHHHAGSHA